ncbi:MAG: YdcF family protein [Opitutales bacterium]|nr:YdcF family protein [Opitutales bacterium]
MFLLSKLLCAVVQPVFWLALWWTIALLLLSRKKKTAVGMLWAGLIFLGLLGFQMFPDALLRPLENKYPVPDEKVIAEHSGVIVLGGAIEHPVSFVAHGQVPTGEAGERMSVPAGWMHRYPHLKLVFAGGEGRLHRTGISEADLARQFYEEQGIEAGRILIESGSRNTRENALNTAKVLGKARSERWLLVTSAAHMPRSVAEFEAAGIQVTPYPVDFKTGDTPLWMRYSMAHSLMRWQIALHEYLGMVVYDLTR